MKKDKKRVLEFYIQNGGHPSKAGVDSAASVIYSSLYSEASGEKISKELFLAP